MANPKPRILIYGTFNPYNFEFCWLEWLQAQAYPARAFDHTGLLEKHFPSQGLQRLAWRLFQPALVATVSRGFVRAARTFRPDLALVVSGHLVSSAALQAIRQESGATLFHFYGEDFFNPLNTNRTLRQSARFYDHLFTTKSFNVGELAAIGLTQASYLPHGYRPNCHYPVAPGAAERAEYGSDLAFVGTWEAERAATLAQLGEFDLRVWGADWEKAHPGQGLGAVVRKRPVYCEEMSRVFNASKINLAFLRKANRDRHTSRTFEIPACGGFQLSERTEEVLSFFEEGQEIECFGSLAELKDKARYYLKHETRRKQIAIAGLKRAQNSPYSYTDRLQTILGRYAGTKPL